MRYPAIVVFVLGLIFLLAWLVSGRRIPVPVHVVAVSAALGTVAFLMWLRTGGKVIEPAAWIAVVVMPVAVYVSFTFMHAMHTAEKYDGKKEAANLPPALPVDPEPWRPAGPSTPLTPEEQARAAAVQIWMVYWQLPDKDWDAFCLSAEDAQRLFELKDADSLIRSWGHAGLRDPQTLLAWYEGRIEWPGSIREENDHRIAREILRRADAGQREPVVIKT